MSRTEPEPIGLNVVTGWLKVPVLHPNEYVWFVFVSALDIMLTWKILEASGTELNPVARFVIERWGLAGAIAFKFSLTVLVIAICEVVGRPQPRTGRWLARTAVAVSAVAPFYSLGLLTYHHWRPTGIL